MSVLVEISENLQKGRAKLVAELVQKALDEKIEAKNGCLKLFSLPAKNLKKGSSQTPHMPSKSSLSGYSLRPK